MNISRQIKDYSGKGPHVKQDTWADADPGVSQDVSSQFDVGSRWTNTTTGTTFLCTSPAVGAAVWVSRSIIPGFDRKVIDEVVTLSAVGAVNLVAQLPAGAIPVCAAGNFDTAIGAYSTAVKTGFGTAASPSGYFLSGTLLNLNTKTRGQGALCGLQVAAATPIRVSSCATDGSAIGQFASGKVRVRLYYDLPSPIPDASV